MVLLVSAAGLAAVAGEAEESAVAVEVLAPSAAAVAGLVLVLAVADFDTAPEVATGAGLTVTPVAVVDLVRS